MGVFMSCACHACPASFVEGGAGLNAARAAHALAALVLLLQSHLGCLAGGSCWRLDAFEQVVHRGGPPGSTTGITLITLGVCVGDLGVSGNVAGRRLRPAHGATAMPPPMPPMPPPMPPMPPPMPPPAPRGTMETAHSAAITHGAAHAARSHLLRASGWGQPGSRQVDSCVAVKASCSHSWLCEVIPRPRQFSRGPPAFARSPTRVNSRRAIEPGPPTSSHDCGSTVVVSRSISESNSACPAMASSPCGGGGRAVRRGV